MPDIQEAEFGVHFWRLQRVNEEIDLNSPEVCFVEEKPVSGLSSIEHDMESTEVFSLRFKYFFSSNFPIQPFPDIHQPRPNT